MPEDTELRQGENPVAEKVSGYRRLSDAELALVNKAKAFGDPIEQLLSEYQAAGADPRAVAIARTEIQTGFMWLIRGIAKPQGLV